MDLLTFVSKLAEVLAWPAVVLIIVSLLRKELSALFAIVKKVKAGPVEAEFEREINELKSVADAELPAVEHQAPATPSQNELEQLAQINPRAAIIEAWRRLELAARRALSQAGIKMNSHDAASPLAHARNLAKSALLSQEELVLFNDLRNLRNMSVHAEKFSPTLEAALSYIEVASRVQQTLHLKSETLNMGTAGNALATAAQKR
ncbi:MAG: hypothetical protein A3I66_10950 [Burkholderiales bacterium RIFCSPLOWO2_02_FULL_57_36]|nr:MAG: hypothetical protein A3I66_10950 [Burkholderiales bacterium RIFCSPLOWO2_02_FULL_57_36]